MKISDFPQDLEPRVGDILEIEQGDVCFEVRIIGITADGYLCEQDNVEGAVLLEGVALDQGDVADITGYITEERVRLDPKCWKGKKIGNPKTKMKGGVRVNNCVPEGQQEDIEEAGPFSYGYKKPRKGSVAYWAEKKRKEQEKGKPPIEPKDQMVGVAKVTKAVSEGSDQYYAIVHKVTGKPLSTHRDLESAKDEWRGLDQDQRHFFKVVTTNKAPKDWSMKEAVAETSDYFRRREREEAIISGQKPARKKQPAQTSDYARRREQEKKAEKGVAEGVDIVKQDYDLDQMVYVLDVDGQKVSFTYWDYEDDFNNPDIKDIYQQAQEQLGKKLSPEQVKEVARAVFKSFEQGVAEGSSPSYLRGESRFVKSAYKTLIKYGFIPDDEDERTAQMGSFNHVKGHMAEITWEGNIKLWIKQPNGKYTRLYLDDATEMPKVAVQLKLAPIGTEQGVAEGYTGRETKDGTWHVFKDGQAVAVAGPFNSRDEAHAWIKKHKQGVSEAKSLKKRVRVVQGEHAGKTGWIREIKHGIHSTAPKRYYVDIDGGGQADNLPASALRLLKNQSDDQTGMAEGGYPSPHNYDSDEDYYAAVDRYNRPKGPRPGDDDWEEYAPGDDIPSRRRHKDDDMDEAKYQGREVPLGKKMAGDVKKSKVYVRKPNGKVVKVNFGDKNMTIKKSNPKRRKSFRARHNCDNPGPRWKARYWSCRSW